MEQADIEAERRISCCWCLRLRTGCIIVASLELLFQIAVTAVCIILSFYRIHWLVIGNLAGLGVSGMLLYGALRENRPWLWLWMMINIIVSSGVGFLAVIFITDYLAQPADEINYAAAMGLPGLITACIALIKALLQLVYEMVVFTYIFELLGLPVSDLWERSTPHTE